MPLFIDSADKKQYLIKQSKVRDVYTTESTDHLVIVAGDRIFAFDHILPTSIPDKSVILTRMAKFWFNKTRHILANYLVDTTSPLKPWFQGEMEKRISSVKKAEPLPVEAFVRGYLAGSGFKDYQRSGKVCGLELAVRLTESAKLPEPLFTPSTKAEVGKHDENISCEETVDLIGEEQAVKVRDISLQLYAFAAKYALPPGIIIADSKLSLAWRMGDYFISTNSSRRIHLAFGRQRDIGPARLNPDSTNSMSGIFSKGWHGTNNHRPRSCRPKWWRKPVKNIGTPCND